jgi:hypothetical protein
MLVIAFANMLYFLISFYEKEWFQNGTQKIWWLQYANLAIFTLETAAFIMLALVVSAFSKVAGFLTVACIVAYYIASFIFWGFQRDKFRKEGQELHINVDHS